MSLGLFKLNFILEESIILCLLLVSGCSLTPLSRDAELALMESIRDRSSCVQIVGGVGGLTITGSPVIPAAVYYGRILVARVLPGHNLEMDQNGCKITDAAKPMPTLFAPRGAAVPSGWDVIYYHPR